LSGALYVSLCRSCGRRAFPPRALCPDCGGAAWIREPAGQGVVEEATRVGALSLASVRLDTGPVVVARLDADAGPGDRVELHAVDGAPVATDEFSRAHRPTS
jgi:uncharacterized OB-fold protein